MKKDLEHFQKKLKRYTDNHIVIGIPDPLFRTLRLKFPIDLLLVHPKGEAVLTNIIKEKVIPNLSENEKVLNANIPEKVLKDAGLSENQYIQTETKLRKEERQKATRHKGRSI